MNNETKVLNAVAIKDVMDKIVSVQSSIASNVNDKLKDIKDGDVKLIAEELTNDVMLLSNSMLDILNIVGGGATDNALSEEDTIKCITAKHLKALGISSALAGHGYIKDAIYYIVSSNKGTYNKKLMSGLLKKVADENNTTVRSTERCIRHAISKAMDNCTPEMLEEYFGGTIGFMSDHPTNSTFLFTVSDIVKGECGING